MSSINRRSFLKLAGTTSLAAALPLSFSFSKGANAAVAGGNIVIIGGGYAGATCAKYLALWGGSNVAVTLIEPNLAADAKNTYIAGPGSNVVLASDPALGISIPANLKRTYSLPTSVVKKALKATGVSSNQVTLEDGSTVLYDKLIFASGISFTAPKNLVAGGITDYTPPDPVLDTPASPSHLAPHAWIPGAMTKISNGAGGFYNQLELLKSKLNAMPTNGVVVMSIPKAARASAAAYSRACVIANFLKAYKPGAKLIVLDANGRPVLSALGNGFVTTPTPTVPGTLPARQTGLQGEIAIFDKAFTDLHAAGYLDYYWGVNYQTLNIGNKTLLWDALGDLTGANPYTSQTIGSGWDVFNYIPDQQAGAKSLINALVTALGHAAPGGFPLVDPLTYKLNVGTAAAPALIDNIFVLGDSSNTAFDDSSNTPQRFVASQPKGAHMANAQAKVCANAIALNLAGSSPDTTPTTVTIGFNPITVTTPTTGTASFATYIYQYDKGAMVRKEYNAGSLNPGQLDTLNATSIPYTAAQFGVPTAPSTTIFNDMERWVGTLSSDSGL